MVLHPSRVRCLEVPSLTVWYVDLFPSIVGLDLPIKLLDLAMVLLHKFTDRRTDCTGCVIFLL